MPFGNIVAVDGIVLIGELHIVYLVKEFPAGDGGAVTPAGNKIPEPVMVHLFGLWIDKEGCCRTCIAAATCVISALTQRQHDIQVKRITEVYEPVHFGNGAGIEIFRS